MILTTADGKKIDLQSGKDISIPLSNTSENPRAWYVEPPIIEPVRTDNWTGAVAEGGTVNFRNIFFNPHGHGTHTECLGHITEKVYSINEHLNTYFFNATLLSVDPVDVPVVEADRVDRVVLRDQLEPLADRSDIEALIIRTRPNSLSKKQRNYSDTNPPYLSPDCLPLLEKMGVRHLLVDLPSVDPEFDDGKLAFHHGFWGVPDAPQFDRTITEMIYIPDAIKDGDYLLNLQVAPFENDAAPSRPVLFEFH
ncbi:MAG: cyclase family protein [Bacteroidota bacterium]